MDNELKQRVNDVSSNIAEIFYDHAGWETKCDIAVQNRVGVKQYLYLHQKMNAQLKISVDIYGAEQILRQNFEKTIQKTAIPTQGENGEKYNHTALLTD